MDKPPDRAEYVQSLDQLLTISSILGGFAFSGVISFPGTEAIARARGSDPTALETAAALWVSFQTMFLATLFFLCALMVLLTYKVQGYFVTVRKLQRLQRITGGIFSLALGALMISIVTFGVPTWWGLGGGLFLGLSVAFTFAWENLWPAQRRFRESQLEKEKTFPPPVHGEPSVGPAAAPAASAGGV